MTTEETASPPNVADSIAPSAEGVGVSMYLTAEDRAALTDEAREFLAREGIVIPPDWTADQVDELYKVWVDNDYRVDSNFDLGADLAVAASEGGTGEQQLERLMHRMQYNALDRDGFGGARVYRGPSAWNTVATTKGPLQVRPAAEPDMFEARTDEDSPPFTVAWKTLTGMLVDAPELRWVWKHYIVREGKTLLVARPKVGKSTTVFGLIGALRRGADDFCGQPIGSNVGVLYLTEETNREALRTKVASAGLDVNDDGLLVVRRVDMNGQRWAEDIIPALHHDARLFRERGEYTDVLIVIDTLSKWAGFEDQQEQDAGATRSAIGALDVLTADGFALLIVHHAGWSANRSRGSTAIVGEVDVALFLDGEPGTSSTRTLKYQGGRMDTGDTPESLNIAFDPTGHLDAFAEGLRPKTADAVMDVLEVVTALGGSATVPEVADRIDRSHSTALRHLRRLVELGHLTHEETMTPEGRRSEYVLPLTGWAKLGHELYGEE